MSQLKAQSQSHIDRIVAAVTHVMFAATVAFCVALHASIPGPGNGVDARLSPAHQPAPLVVV